MSRHDEGWRWDPAKHLLPVSHRTVYVTEPTDEQNEQHAQAVRDGARVVPFGFGPRDEALEQPQPEAWIDWEDVGR